MRFLITGGAGFLGSALANRLAADGHLVQVLDDLSNGDRDKLADNVIFRRGDVNDVPLLWSMLQDIDCVYHLAARVSVAQSILYPREYNLVNVGGTVSLMEAVRDAGVRRVVFASSGAIYGRQSKPVRREHDTPQPDTPYAVSKWAGEQYLHTIGELSGIETVALRIFNAYGPGQGLPASHGPVIPRFLRQALTGGSLVIYGDGTQVRDFVYISDVIAALIHATQVSGVNRQVINIGSGEGIDINALADLVGRVTGRSVNPIYNREKSGGVEHLVADISLARRLLDFDPLVSLERGLERILREDPRFSAA
jgi:UDP-glucose 4-epimerase